MCACACVCVCVLCVCVCVCVCFYTHAATTMQYLCLRFIEIFVGPEPYVYCVYAVCLAGKSPNIRSYTVHIYGSGQPYIIVVGINEWSKETLKTFEAGNELA